MDVNVKQINDGNLSAPIPDNADGQASGNNLVGTVARLQVLAGGTYYRLAGGNLADGVTPGVGLIANSFMSGFNGASWDRVRIGGAGILSGVTQPYSILVTRPGDWTVTHAPVANTQATASKAAGGAGVRHLCTSISARLLGGTTAPAAVQGTLTLRDGATGAGTILWSQTVVLAAAVGAKDEVSVTGLNIVGSANTAMTLEFAAAGGLNTFESVSMTGYSVA